MFLFLIFLKEVLYNILFSRVVIKVFNFFSSFITHYFWFLLTFFPIKPLIALNFAVQGRWWVEGEVRVCVVSRDNHIPSYSRLWYCFFFLPHITFSGKIQICCLVECIYSYKHVAHYIGFHNAFFPL